MKKRILITLLAALVIAPMALAQKQKSYVIGFYNLENLFDTYHDEGKNDYEYLPDGANEWTEAKYEKKLYNMAHVIAAMKKDNKVWHTVLGVSEVENRHVHCHDDLGLAAANSLAALAAGASAAHCTLNGIGERAGNCPLEELAVAIALKPSLGLAAPLRLRELYPASRLVSQLTGFPVPRNKAVVGLNAFAHEAGVHQDGLLKNRDTYEFVHPETVGRSGGFELVLGRHSGRAGFIDHLARLGIEVPPDRLAPLYDAFAALADKKKTVYDDDLVELLREHLSVVPRVYALRALQVTTGAPSIPTATVRLEKDGALLQDSATGAGPVEAAFRAIDRITGLAGHLKSFLVQSVTRGQDALGEVSLQVAFDSPSAPPVSAKGSDTDIILASAKAYLNALNRHLSRP